MSSGKLNRTCIICNTRYEYCGHCDHNLRAKETWRNIYCSEACRETFGILEQFTAKKITADSAIKKMEELGVDRDKISSTFKKTLDSIELQRSKTKNVVVEEKPKVNVEALSRKKKRRNKRIVKDED